MTKSSLRSVVVAATVGSFSIAALLGVIALLGGGSFRESEGRILLTTLLVGSASIGVLCYLAAGGTPYRWVGVLGGVTVLVPVVTGLVMIWQSWDSDSDWGLLKTFGVGTTLAVAFAQICLLLALAHDRRSLQVLLWGTVALALVLSATISVMIIGETASDAGGRFLGVVAILNVLGTVVTIALAKFGSRAPSALSTRGASTVTVSLPAGLLVRADAYAVRTGVTRDALAAEALERYLPATGSSA